MRFEILGLAAIAAGVQGAVTGGSYGNGTVYETITTTALTTYCPASTTFTHGTNTYIVTEATTLTITDCPCTITRPVSSSSSQSTPSAYTTTSAVLTTSVAATTSVAPVYSSHPSAGSSSIPIYSNTSTVFSYTTKSPGSSTTGTATSVPVSTFTGAANKVAASGAGLAGLIGLAAYIL